MIDRREPVKNTCPLIDNIIDDLKEVYNEVNWVIDKMEDSGLFGKETIDNLNNMMHKVDLISCPNGFMEELRAANDALRTWGNDLVNDLNEIEDENYLQRI